MARARMVPAYDEVPEFLAEGDPCFVGGDLYVGDVNNVPQLVPSGGGGGDGLPVPDYPGNFLVSDQDDSWTQSPVATSWDPMTSRMEGIFILQRGGMYLSPGPSNVQVDVDGYRLYSSIFNPCGPWVEGSFHLAGDVVQHDGKLWYANKGTLGEPGVHEATTPGNGVVTARSVTTNVGSTPTGSWQAFLVDPADYGINMRYGKVSWINFESAWFSSSNAECRVIAKDVWDGRGASDSVLDLDTVAVGSLQSQTMLAFSSPVSLLPGGFVVLVNAVTRFASQYVERYGLDSAVQTVVVDDLMAPPAFTSSQVMTADFIADVQPWTCIFDPLL